VVIASHQGGTGLIDSGLEATYGWSFLSSAHLIKRFLWALCIRQTLCEVYIIYTSIQKWS